MAESSQVVCGYHGTNRLAAERILSEGFRLSANEYDWLGKGVYFFDSEKRAHDWAHELFGDSGVVLVADLDIHDCIDLQDQKWTPLLRLTYEQVVEAFRRSGRRLPRQTRGAHHLDRLVVDEMCDALEKRGIHARVVRTMFSEGGAAFPGSAIMTGTHIQFAVRDLSAISRLEVLP